MTQIEIRLSFVLFHAICSCALLLENEESLDTFSSTLSNTTISQKTAATANILVPNFSRISERDFILMQANEQDLGN
jgi:hypothetical protein